jgi:hypothetical protein
MKERLINTRFWSDNWVRKLNALDRYLFIYLLTNEHTNISGIYEIPISTMAFESGIDERDLEKTMLPKLKPKVFYKDGWIILKNFVKYQRIKSESVVIGIKKSLNEAPKSILEYAKKQGYWDGVGVIPPSSHILESESELESEGEGHPPLIPQTISLKEQTQCLISDYKGRVEKNFGFIPLVKSPKSVQSFIQEYGFKKATEFNSWLNDSFYYDKRKDYTPSISDFSKEWIINKFLKENGK